MTLTAWVVSRIDTDHMKPLYWDGESFGALSNALLYESTDRARNETFIQRNRFRVSIIPVSVSMINTEKSKPERPRMKRHNAVQRISDQKTEE